LATELSEYTGGSSRFFEHTPGLNTLIPERESDMTIFLAYPFLIVLDFLDIRVNGRNEIVNEDTLSGSRDFVRAVQEVIQECVRSVIVQNLNFSLVFEPSDGEFKSTSSFCVFGDSVRFVVDTPAHDDSRIVPHQLQDILCHPELLV